MFKKNFYIISKKVKTENSLKFLKSFLGKKVYSKSGEYLGTIKDLITDKEKIIGVIVEGKLQFYLDKEDFDLNDNDVIILKIDPVVSLIGKKVFDKEGKDLGVVVDLERKSNNNTFVSLIVSRNLLKKDIKILKEDISISKDSIILKKEFKDE